MGWEVREEGWEVMGAGREGGVGRAAERGVAVAVGRQEGGGAGGEEVGKGWEVGVG